MVNNIKTLLSSIAVSLVLSVFMLVVVPLAAPVLATQVQEKVNICHSGNGKNYESIEVDKDAWDEHESAHSDHEFDFLITEGNPCPPVQKEEPKDVCKNLEGIQTEVPEGYHQDKCDCVKDDPKEEEPVATPSAPIATPSAPLKAPELPKTGGGIEFALLALAVIGIGIGTRYLLRNKG